MSWEHEPSGAALLSPCSSSLAISQPTSHATQNLTPPNKHKALPEDAAPPSTELRTFQTKRGLPGHEVAAKASNFLRAGHKNCVRARGGQHGQLSSLEDRPQINTQLFQKTPPLQALNCALSKQNAASLSLK